jgi:hypothetical protein
MIEVLKQALDALENIIDAVYVNSKLEAIAVKHANIVIAALKEALAEHAMQEVQRLGHEIEQEPVAWINAEKRTFEWNGPVLWNTPTVAVLNKIPLYTHPPQGTEQNFCSRCGKRTPDLITIHTCTPPKEST